MKHLKKTKPASVNRTKRPKRVAAKPCWEMTTDELRRVTAEFDGESAADSFGEPMPQQRAQDRRARSRLVGRSDHITPG